MPDARALREIAEALDVLKEKAAEAGSTTVRSVLIMTAEAVRKGAEKAEREAQVRAWRPTGKTQRSAEE